MSLHENDLHDEALLESIMENLTGEQEDILQDIHARGYNGTDDNMPDAYEHWLVNLTLAEVQDYLKLEVPHA